jgi:putative flippase GtrA
MGDKAKALVRQILSFNIVGAVNTAITYGIYSLLVFLGLPYLLALGLEYCFGLTFSFFLNKRFTFKDGSRTTAASFGKMVVSYALVLALNMILLSWFVEGLGMGKYLGQLFALSFSVACSFFLQKFVVFKSPKGRAS